MLSNDVKTAIGIGAGALYVYVGVKKEESASWTFDALLVVGIVLIGTILYGLFKKRGGGGRRRGSRAPFARPHPSSFPVDPAGTDVAPKSSAAPYAAIPEAQRAKEGVPRFAAPFAPSGTDSLAEWTTTAPGEDSWNPTLVPIERKPGAPDNFEVRGFAFK